MNQSNAKPRSGQQGGDKGRSRRRRRPGGGGGQGQNQKERPEPEISYKAPPVLKTYGVLFYETHAQAREDSERLKEVSAQFDQLNIVVRAEGSMDDPELTIYGRVYAGEAWNLIHKRRMEEGWYNDKHE